MTIDTAIDSRRLALFNLETFNEQQHDSSSPILCFKNCIKQARTILDARFLNEDEIEIIIQDESWFNDQILTMAWCQYDWKEATDISLVAVGGYGRGELHPYSDIDIQILLEKNNVDQYRENIESFLTFLWDISLEVGQSVRSIKDNLKEAAKDITIATALLESRTIYGNSALHQQVMEKLSSKKIWKPKEFFKAKKAEQEARHAKHKDIEYALEPNLKLAPGGLRDIQTIGWIAKCYFGANDFKELVDRGFLQKPEYNDLIKGRNFLWRLRYGLHMINDRREDRLLFEYQRKLAELFGYNSDSKSLSIEKLMKEYYQSVLTLRELNDVLLQLFDEEILRSKERIKIKPINSRFQIRNNYIEAVNSRVFLKTPMALIEIFVLQANDVKIEGIRASTIRLIRNSLKLIDTDFRKDIRNTSMFMELLSSPNKIVWGLRKMKHYGVLAAYLPEFGKIIGQMQHDLFHIYTVDDHTLQVMENMRTLRHPEAKEKFPVAALIVNQLPKMEILYIAGLYHDIAKGRGGDHSILGVKDAHSFCKLHHISKSDTQLVGWLVENHLRMSAVAQREDIQSPDVIKEFALRVGDQIHLDYLYILTVADINGTNPNLWNSWRASLLRQLYQLTKRALSQGLESAVGKEDRIKETTKEALLLLKEKGFTEKQVHDIWQTPDEDYFLRENANDIAWQTDAIAQHKAGDAPLIKIRTNMKNSSEGASQIFIYTEKSRVLFANIATAFDRLNLNIQDARQFSNQSRKCLNIFMVLESHGLPVGKNKERLKEIQSTLSSYVDSKEAKPAAANKKTSRKLRHFTRGTETTLTNNKNAPYSILEVLCPDRPGLLAIVANIFVELNITLHNAKITTLGENVEDVFFITDSNNKPLKNQKLIDELQHSIRQQLDADIQH